MRTLSVYPSNFEQKIAFDTIRIKLKECCLSPLGKRQVDQMQFENEYELICKRLQETEEFRQILLFESWFPSQDYFDLTAQWERLQIEGTCIDVENLCKLRASLQTIQDCLSFFATRAESGTYPELTALSAKLSFDFTLVGKINRILDDKGEIRDSASEDLQAIRTQIRSLESSIFATVRSLLQQSKAHHLLDESAEITIRNGRFVLPIPAVNKRKIKGVVQDESSSGQTFFIEPQAVFESNNRLHNLLMDQQREIMRILIQFTRSVLFPLLPDVMNAFHYLGVIDFIRAKATFALHINACKPLVNNRACLQWKKAVHPLLYLLHKAQNKEVVPLDIELGNSFSILIISGPNAGGKSVCLKTLALLQYMLQCGLLASVSELSEFGIFDALFLDMGDEQSIDNDLSTYSSHLKNMQAMVEHTTEKSLFLMDELGAGTDPQYGGAIAEALLEFLASKPTCGLVTTHFGNLKRLSEKYPSIENGAMLFDEKEMRPRYQLKTGQSGTSFTFEMAEKIGLDKAIIRQAIGKVGRMQIQYEKLLRKMERKQLELDKQQKMMEFTDTQLAALIQQYTTKNVELKQKRIEIIKEARNEAKMLVRDTNKLIEKTVREVRESNADKEVIKTLRKEIEQFTHEIEQKEKQETEAIPVVEQPPIEAEAVQLHDMVLLQDTHTVGEVTFMDNKDIIVSFNSINLKTTLDKVQKISNAQQKKLNKSYTKEIYASLATKVENFKLQLDLRGMRAPDALAELGRYLDDALLLSIHKVRILHGKGNGILRMIVREYLAKDKQVTAFYDESPEHGGHGITVVEMD